MNPEIIKITIENKAFLDALNSQMPNQPTSDSAISSKSLKISGIWKIAFVSGILVLIYNIHSYYNKKNKDH
jgi:hypothetical protein